MRASVRFRSPVGTSTELGHGDFIGRLASARMVIDDPRVSEAHAMVSVRRGELVLMALRGMFSVRGRPVAETVLRDGMQIDLAEDLALRVEQITRPRAVLAIEIEGAGRRTLAGVTTVVLGPTPRIVPHFEPEGDLFVWWNGNEWRARTPRGESRLVREGDSIKLKKHDAQFVLVPLDSAITTPRGGGVAPLRVVAWYDAVEVHREGKRPATFGGVGARILSELVAIGGPVDWQTVARQIWTDPADIDELRHRWDVALARLRARLKEIGVRDDLLRSDGTGNVQLVFYESDLVEDRT